jgi:hypothetical protein
MMTSELERTNAKNSYLGFFQLHNADYNMILYFDYDYSWA